MNKQKENYVLAFLEQLAQKGKTRQNKRAEQPTKKGCPLYENVYTSFLICAVNLWYSVREISRL